MEADPHGGVLASEMPSTPPVTSWSLLAVVSQDHSSWSLTVEGLTYSGTAWITFCMLTSVWCASPPR